MAPMLSGRCLSVLSAVCDVGVLWPNGCRGSRCHLVAYGDRPRPRPHCVRWGPSSPPTKRGTAAPPLFGLRLLRRNGRAPQELPSSCSATCRDCFGYMIYADIPVAVVESRVVESCQGTRLYVTHLMQIELTEVFAAKRR